MGNKLACNNYSYEDSDIFSGNCYIGNSLAAEELSIDTLDASLNFGNGAALCAANGDRLITADGGRILVGNPISGYKYGDIMTYEYDNALIGKFYVEKAIKTGRTRYDFSNFSAMGLLDNRTHYGGMYVSVETGTIIADIMGDIPYSITTDVSTVALNGWLPKDTCRANLHQVLFAVGAGVFKDSNGDIVIRFVTAQTPSNIADSRIYISGTVDYKTPCTKVNVTEHSFSAFSGNTEKTLFTTTESVTNELIEFDNPCHDLSVGATGLTIVSSGVNYAIVSGTGTLTGKEYTHTQKVLSYDTGVTGVENIASITDATLVSALNSYNVALRVAQYYSEVATANVGIVVGAERPTTEVAFNNPFNEATQGYIKSMDITLSTTLKSDTEIAVGFVPTGQGNNYNDYITLTGFGTWTNNTGKTRFRLVASAAGNGGNGGYDGADGGKAGGAGGGAGAGGAAGKVYVANITIPLGATVSFACGVKGTGGAVGTAGTAGTDTTFGSYSSADGNLYEAGYYEPLSQLVLAVPGTNGVAGGNGGGYDANGVGVMHNGTTYNGGVAGDNYYTYPGPTTKYYGGGGGGAAVGNNGEDGVDATAIGQGMAGNGANAIVGANAATYGSGGEGGHGGGGGGGTKSGSGDGVGGLGSAAGNGANGCAILCY